MYLNGTRKPPAHILCVRPNESGVESGDEPFPFPPARPPDLFNTARGFVIGLVALVAPVCVRVSSSAGCVWHLAILAKLYPAVAQWKVSTFCPHHEVLFRQNKPAAPSAPLRISQRSSNPPNAALHNTKVTLTVTLVLGLCVCVSALCTHARVRAHVSSILVIPSRFSLCV